MPHDHKAHADHNRDACDHLIGKGFDDWVITTAFYSAMHYLCHNIFPVTIGGTLYQGFDQYCEDRSRETKHHLMLEVVNTTCQNRIYDSYRLLYEKCMNARYDDYLESSSYAGACRAALSRIETYCADDY